MHDPETRNPAACQGAGGISQTNFHTADYDSDAEKLQAQALNRRFGIGFYLATVVAQLAWGIAR